MYSSQYTFRNKILQQFPDEYHREIRQHYWATDRSAAGSRLLRAAEYELCLPSIPRISAETRSRIKRSRQWFNDWPMLSCRDNAHVIALFIFEHGWHLSFHDTRTTANVG